MTCRASRASTKSATAGHIRSLDRYDARGRFVRGRRLLCTRNSGGYRKANLHKDGKVVPRTVHTLVCEVFHGPRPPGHSVRHLDGDCLNNQASNLRWGTHAENMADQVRHGTHAYSKRERCAHGHLYPTNAVPGRKRLCRTCRRRMWREDQSRRYQRRADLPPTVIRPNGQVYRPRKIRVISWDGEDFGMELGSPPQTAVLGTHDVDVAREFAKSGATAEYLVNPKLGWLSLAPRAGELRWVDDPERGAACVIFDETDDPPARAAVRALREAPQDVDLCQGCGNPKSEGLHGMSEYGGCV